MKKATIDDYARMCKSQEDCTKCPMAETIQRCHLFIEKHPELLKKKCKDINTARKIIKSEAIKEFAERLIRTADGDDEYGTVFVFNIEDLVKEMTKGE